MVPKSDHLANPRFDKKPSAQVNTNSIKVHRDSNGNVPSGQAYFDLTLSVVMNSI